MRNIHYFIISGLIIFFCTNKVIGQKISISGGVLNNMTLYVPPPPPGDSCIYIAEWIALQPSNKSDYKIQYDKVRHYVDTCAGSDTGNFFKAFSTLDQDVEYYAPSDTTRYDRYRTWLISVLYLSPIPKYFCSCLNSVSNSYGIGIYENVPNAPLSVYKFMIDAKVCNTENVQLLYSDYVQNRHNLWLAGDTTKPEDTLLPSLESLGLGILLKHANVNSNSALYLNSIESFTAIPNPVKTTTTLKFTLNRMAYIQLAIYDELGRLALGDGKGSSLDAGTHTVQIDGSNFPSGTLYARISTGFGEVKTVKLEHLK